MSLQAREIPAASLCADARHDMLLLMNTYYDGVSTEQFSADLCAKDRVILLEEGGRICGFSTQQVLRHPAPDGPVRVVFSGDTIIEREYRRSMALPVAWCCMMKRLFAEEPEVDLYWLLTSKGYKTYRYLPIFFRMFFPSFLWPTPPREQALLCNLGRQKFGARFDSDRGVAVAEPGGQRLRPGVGDVTEGRRRDPHVAFFERVNPGYANGDELVCLALWHPSNMSPFIMKRLGEI